MHNPSPLLAADDLLAKARDGDRQAFGSLVRAHQRTVYGLALRMLGTADRAEDLAQDVFVQLHGKLRSIESSAHLAFWLRKVTTHRAIDALRSRAHETLTPLDDVPSAAASHAADPLLQRALARLFERLSPQARAVMTLRYQEDLDPGEIARALEIPVNTVKSHLKRSLHSLRAGFAEPGSTPARILP